MCAMRSLSDALVANFLAKAGMNAVLTSFKAAKPELANVALAAGSPTLQDVLQSYNSKAPPSAKIKIVDAVDSGLEAIALAVVYAYLEKNFPSVASQLKQVKTPSGNVCIDLAELVKHYESTSKKIFKATGSSDSSDSDEEDSEEEEDMEVDNETPKAAIKKPALMSATKTPSAFKRKPTDDDEDEDDDEDDAPPAKRIAFATSTPHNTLNKSDSGFDDQSGNSGSKKKLPVTPFRRVTSDKNEIQHHALKDNSYKSFDSWGAKANRDLIVTKGKSFRHEKTKKKRGSYKGGQINAGVNSFKFDD